MKAYELLFFVSPTIEDEVRLAAMKRVETAINDNNGTIDNVEDWGRRKLAYEIAGKTEGNYVVVKYTAEPATSDELDRVLNLNESVIRTKILRKG